MCTITIPAARICLLVAFALVIIQCGETPKSTSTSAPVIPMPIIEVRKSNSQPVKRPISTQTIPQNNCGGTAAITNDIELSHTIIHTIQLQGSVSVDAKGKVGVPGVGDVEIGASIAAEYGTEYGEQQTITRRLSVTAKEGTNVNQNIQQVEYWEIGEVLVKVAGTEVARYPYEFRSDFGIELIEAIPTPCAVAAAPPTPVLPTQALPTPVLPAQALPTPVLPTQALPTPVLTTPVPTDLVIPALPTVVLVQIQTIEPILEPPPSVSLPALQGMYASEPGNCPILAPARYSTSASLPSKNTYFIYRYVNFVYVIAQDDENNFKVWDTSSKYQFYYDIKNNMPSSDTWVRLAKTAFLICFDSKEEQALVLTRQPYCPNGLSSCRPPDD